MKVKNVLLFTCLVFSLRSVAQHTTTPYIDSINAYVANYIATHEVVKGDDRKHIHFFPPDSTYQVAALFEKTEDMTGFKMPTSGQSPQHYYRYGKITFIINGHSCQLTVYQSKSLLQREEYKNYLFIPFTDGTTGQETYEGGRYIDILTTDIRDDKVVVDFNKAYNPYCCYRSGYNCPIPPEEKALPTPLMPEK